MTSTPNTSPASERVPEMVERIHGVLQAMLFEEPAGDLFDVARAVIAEMREPSAGMADQGSEAVDPDNDNGIWDMEHNGPYLTDTGARAVWQAMIDEALR